MKSFMVPQGPCRVMKTRLVKAKQYRLYILLHQINNADVGNVLNITAKDLTFLLFCLKF